MKTTTAVYTILFFLIFLLVASCQKDSEVLNSTLSKVEKCMDVYPDSALNLLKTIPHPENLHGKSQADYALLMTQAMDKNYIEISSDSLIMVALNYYTVDQRNPAMKAKALFYYGRVMLEMDNHEAALKSFLSARKIYESIHEQKMLALIAEEIGMINRMQKIYQEALSNFNVSLSYFEQKKDSISIIRTCQNIARVYLYENRWDSSYLYYNRALEIAQQKQHKSEVSILHELGVLYRLMKNLPKAESYFLASLDKETNKDKKSMECLSLGYLYLQMGKNDNARKYLNLSLESTNPYTKIDAYNCLCLVEKSNKNFEKAIVYLENADSINSSMEAINSRELIADLQKKYENEKLQKENLQIKVRYINLALWGTVAFLAVAFSLCYYYYKNRNNKKRILEIESQIRNNKEEISRYQYEIKEIGVSNKQILAEKLNKIGELNGKIMILLTQNKTLNEQLGGLGGKVNVGVIFEHYISTFRLLLAIKEGTYNGKLSKLEGENLFKLFDFLYLNYVSRLRERASALTKHDLEICCLLKLGVSHEELSSIFNTTSDSVTRAKTRLKGRLGISSSEDLELFLMNF